MASMNNKVKVWMYFKGPTTEANNFAEEVKVMIGFESTPKNGLAAKTGFNSPFEL